MLPQRSSRTRMMRFLSVRRHSPGSGVTPGSRHADRRQLLGALLDPDFATLNAAEQSILIRSHELDLQIGNLLRFTNETAAASKPVSIGHSFLRALQVETAVRQRLQAREPFAKRVLASFRGSAA